MLLQVNIYRLFNLTRKGSLLDPFYKLEIDYRLWMPATRHVFTIKSVIFYMSWFLLRTIVKLMHLNAYNL